MDGEPTRAGVVQDGLERSVEVRREITEFQPRVERERDPSLQTALPHKAGRPGTGQIQFDDLRSPQFQSPIRRGDRCDGSPTPAGGRFAAGFNPLFGGVIVATRDRLPSRLLDLDVSIPYSAG